MKIFKFLLCSLWAILGSMSFVACGSDDKDEPSSSMNIVGTWVCVETNNDINGEDQGLSVGEALIFFDSQFTSNDKKFSGKKCFIVYGSDSNLNEYTVSKWDSMIDTYDDEFEPIYQLEGNKLTIMECDLDRYVGTITQDGDELTFTYKYQDWNYDDWKMVSESKETYVSKFKRH